MVTIYALEHDGRAYVGSGFDPAKRLRAHVEGTGAKCTRQWIREIAPALPEFKELGEYPESDRVPAEEGWIGEYVRQGWDMVNGTFRVWPIDSEAAARGGRNQPVEVKRRVGRVNVRKMHEANRANGYEAQRQNIRKVHTHPDHSKWSRRGGRAGARKTTAIHRANGWKSLRPNVRKMNEANKANGYEAQRRTMRIVGRKTAATDEANGWKNARRAGRIGIPKALAIQKAAGWEHQRQIGRTGAHNRWHRDRGIVNPDCKLCRSTEGSD